MYSDANPLPSQYTITYAHDTHIKYSYYYSPYDSYPYVPLPSAPSSAYPSYESGPPMGLCASAALPLHWLQHAATAVKNCTRPMRIAITANAEGGSK